MEITETEAWIAFLDMRAAKGKRAPFTDFAKTRILFELRRLAADGHDIEEVLWASVTNGWSGVFAPKRKSYFVPGTVESKDVEKSKQWIAEHSEPTSVDREAVAARLKLAKQRLTGAA